MLAVPSKTHFCKVSILYDTPNFFKLHSNSFGMDPRIIGAINFPLSHIIIIIFIYYYPNPNAHFL